MPYQSTKWWLFPVFTMAFSFPAGAADRFGDNDNTPLRGDSSTRLGTDPGDSSTRLTTGRRSSDSEGNDAAEATPPRQARKNRDVRVYTPDVTDSEARLNTEGKVITNTTRPDLLNNRPAAEE